MHKTQNHEFDEYLKQLAILAQQHSPLSQDRRLAITKLINEIVQSGRLCHPHYGHFSGDYEDIYNDAVQELLLYICQNIDKYNPERGSVMAWANVLLERRFFREAIPRTRDKLTAQHMTLIDLDNIAVPEETNTLTEMIKDCLDLDPENLFKKEYIKDYPSVNFQAVAKRRMVGKSWDDIAAEFKINRSTVSSFYYRCVGKFSSKFKEYCSE